MQPSALVSYVERVRARRRRLSRREEHRLARRVRSSGDPEAARALVNAHLSLVVKITREFRHRHPNRLELIQEGNVALIRAVHRYDPDAPVTLAAYVASWVRTYLDRFVAAHTDAVDADDAALLGSALAPDPSSARAADLLLEERQDRARLAAALPAFELQLTAREREVFRARLIAAEPATLSQTGSELGLSAERVRQIELDLTQRLRARLVSPGTGLFA